MDFQQTPVRNYLD